jgi:hypothetical protein
MPIHSPFTNTLVAVHTSDGRISSSDSTLNSSQNCFTGSADELTDTYAISARFFTRPHAPPSGVSAGQTMPHCVLCSWRGLASLPSRPIGALRRRRCESIDEYVRRLSTCATPVLTPAPPCMPQLPVASEYLRPLVMMLGLTAIVRLNSLP